MKILVVDDEQLLVKGIKFSLENEGYQVLTAYDGAAAVELARREPLDLIILDLMMPFMDGMTCLREMRKRKIDTPVIMLTARGEEYDKLAGLEGGADDYVVKPFSPRELVARVKVGLARTMPKTQEGGESFVFGDLVIDTASHSVKIAGEEAPLTPKEFDLLELLAKNPNKVYSRENLLNIVWGYEYPGDARTVDVHIRRLREKIESNPSEPKYVHTKWGVGYYFQA